MISLDFLVLESPQIEVKVKLTAATLERVRPLCSDELRWLVDEVLCGLREDLCLTADFEVELRRHLRNSRLVSESAWRFIVDDDGA